MGKSIKKSVGGFTKGSAIGSLLLSPGDPFVGTTVGSYMAGKSNAKEKVVYVDNSDESTSSPAKETESIVNKENPFGLNSFGQGDETGWLNESAGHDLKLYKKSSLLGG